MHFLFCDRNKNHNTSESAGKSFIENVAAFIMILAGMFVLSLFVSFVVSILI